MGSRNEHNDTKETKRILVALGRTIQERRNSKNMSQSELAHRSALTAQQVKAIEMGRIDPPLHHLVAIAKALRCALEALVQSL